jgi:septal ring factor EnvC (AmiA/AmiB activator)
LADEKDDASLEEAQRTAAREADREAALRKEKEQTKAAMLRREGESIDRDEKAPVEEHVATGQRSLRVEYGIIGIAALVTGPIAGVLLARLGGDLAIGGRPVLIPLAAEAVFLGIALFLVHSLKRS